MSDHKTTIKPLSPQLTALIAAGEVVERPASVVKELVENALDAGAKAISVEVRDGGLALIRVSDDGIGMSRLDAPLALQAFSTSKIRTPADLNRIRTYGFRGEALSSMASVAQVDILTRVADEVEGTQIISRPSPNIAQAANLDISPSASPVGTRVTLSGLFASTPARRKFLKSPMRELELIQQSIEKYALAHPNVAFRLMADERPRMVLPPGSGLERIGAIMGRDMADEMIPINWQAMDLHIQGYISTPSIARSRRDRQYFYVNGRPVRSGLLAVMLERPYSGRLPPGRHPLAVVQIEVDPGFVDVNVHPQKVEVRFSRERSIYGALSQAVNDALHEFPRQVFGDEALFPWPFAGVNGPEGVLSLAEDQAPYEVGALRALAQIHQTYILAQATEGVLIVDQHAAHEQVLYERCSAGNVVSAAVERIQLSLTAPEATLLISNLTLFHSLGFDIAPFGDRTFLLRQLPSALVPHLSNQVIYNASQPNEAALVTTLLEELGKHKTQDSDTQRDRLAQKAACVCALKSGDVLSEDIMQQLLADLVETWSPAACPHGRPVFVGLSLEEIARRFGRRP